MFRFIPPAIAFLVVLPFGASCELNPLEAQQTNSIESPSRSELVVLAHAHTREDLSSPLDCAGGVDVTLLSDGERLHVASRHPAEGCPGAVDRRSYEVERVEVVDGVKVYSAHSPLGKLWIYDNRTAGDDGPAWTVQTVEFEIDPIHDPWRTTHATEVHDRNRIVSGENVYSFLVYLNEPVLADDFCRLVFPLMVVRGATIPDDWDTPTMYELMVVSDLEVEHVVAQLTALAPIRAVRVVPGP